MTPDLQRAVRIPVLTYHSIDDSGSVISMTRERFASQMTYLKETSFNVLPLREVVKHLRECRPFPENSVAITFDDGFKNFYAEAYPLLKDFEFPATVFVVTGRCGRDNQWAGQLEGIPVMDLLGWDEILEMAGNGIEFGAHTVNHPKLLELTPKEARSEIETSKSMLEERLGQDVPCFAYPYGTLTPEIRQVIEDNFESSFSTELGFATLKSDRYAIPRIDMYYFSKNSRFPRLGRPSFSYYIAWRRLLRTTRALFAVQ